MRARFVIMHALNLFARHRKSGAGAHLGSAAQPSQRLGRAEFAFEVALEGLEGEAAQVLGAAARPEFGGKGGDGGAEHALGQLPGVGGKSAAAAMDGTEETVCVGVEGNLAWLKRFTTRGAVGDVRQ
jgi:hypothetical protein